MTNDAKCSAEAVSGFCLSCGCSAPPDGGCWKDQRGAAVVAEGSTGAYTGAETRPEGTGCAGVESREPVPVAQSAPLPSPAAYLVTYYEDMKAGARKCCTIASLEPYPPTITAKEEDVENRVLIRATPLFESPAAAKEEQRNG